MEQVIELIVDSQNDGKRVDAYLRENTTFSRSRISALIQDGALRISGELELKPSRKIYMAQEILLTSAGLKELEDELEYLRVTGRQEIKEKIQVALSFGDLSENAEYDEARNDQGKLEARISEIEDILSRAKLIDEDALSTDVIQMGSKVTIKDIEYGDIYKYQIISSTSTSKDKGVDYLTSDESPVAKALIGHAAGDIVEVEAPIGIIKYEVIEITK